MFKKLKAELKAAFKSKKTGASKAAHSEVQPLQEQQHRVAQTGDGGLGRPRGLGGRKSVDVTRQGSESKDTGDVRPTYTSESGTIQHHVERANSHDAANTHNNNHNSSPPARLLTHPSQIHTTATEQQQQHSRQQQCRATGSPLDTPQSPQSPCSPHPQLIRHVSESAASTRYPAALAAAVEASPDPAVSTGDPAAAADQPAAVTAPSSRSRKAATDTSSRRHSVGHTAAAGASASRLLGPEPSRTPRDEDLGTCPPYATKAVWGLRYSMEDKWAAVPNLIQVPLVLTAQQKKPSSAPTKGAGCGCIIKPSKVLAKVSPGRADKNLEQVPLVASHHGSDELLGGSQELPLLGSTAAPDMDSLHYFGVFDGHGGADAARHCAHRMHQVLVDTIRTMLSPDVAVVVAAAAASDAASNNDDPAPDAQQPVQQQPSVGPSAAAPGGSDSAQGSEAAAPAASSSANNSVTAAGSVNSAHSSSKECTMTLASTNGNWLLAALSKAFVSLDSEFGVLSEGSYVGSTAVVLLLGSSKLWVAHAGDSRAVLGRKGSAVVLTSDHKASRDDEVARVQAAGGHVWWDRVMGELAVSRAIGDHCLRPYVIPEPEVSMVERTRDDEVLVMASDGLWDVINNQEAAEMALHSLQAAETAGHVGVAAAKRAATSLTKAALDRGTRDNVTVLVVDLRAKGSQHGGSNSNTSAGAATVPAAAGGAMSTGYVQDKSSSSSNSNNNSHEARDKKGERLTHHAVTADAPVVSHAERVNAAELQQQQQDASPPAGPPTVVAPDNPAASLL